MISAMIGGMLPYHKILETSQDDFCQELNHVIDETVLLDFMKTGEYKTFITKFEELSNQRENEVLKLSFGNENWLMSLQACNNLSN